MYTQRARCDDAAQGCHATHARVCLAVGMIQPWVGGGTLEVPGCARSKLTVWKDCHFTLKPKVGIAKRAQRMDELVAKVLSMAKPGSLGCVQSHDLRLW